MKKWTKKHGPPFTGDVFIADIISCPGYKNYLDITDGESLLFLPMAFFPVTMITFRMCSLYFNYRADIYHFDGMEMSCYWEPV